MQWLPFTVSLSWDEVLPPGGYTENNFYYATMETIMCREKPVKKNKKHVVVLTPWHFYLTLTRLFHM